MPYHYCIATNLLFWRTHTVIPAYSERGYSEYPLTVNGFLCIDFQFIVKLSKFIMNTVIPIYSERVGSAKSVH